MSSIASNSAMWVNDSLVTRSILKPVSQLPCVRLMLTARNGCPVLGGLVVTKNHRVNC
jgi:hypothetical protein